MTELSRASLGGNHLWYFLGKYLNVQNFSGIGSLNQRYASTSEVQRIKWFLTVICPTETKTSHFSSKKFLKGYPTLADY